MNFEELEDIKCCFQFGTGDELNSKTDLVHLLTTLESEGAQFVDYKTRAIPKTVFEVVGDNYPASFFDSITLRHPTLQPDVRDYSLAGKLEQDPKLKPGGTGMAFLPDARTACLRSSVCFPDENPAKIECVAVGLLQFMHHFAPIFNTAYGFVDATAEATYPVRDFTRTGTISYLCWANYFGPQIVAEVGEDFILDAPGWQSVKLSCGGVIYVVTENFLDWFHGKHRAFVKHWRQVFPDIEEM